MIAEVAEELLKIGDLKTVEEMAKIQYVPAAYGESTSIEIMNRLNDLYSEYLGDREAYQKKVLRDLFDNEKEAKKAGFIISMTRDLGFKELSEEMEADYRCEIKIGGYETPNTSCN